MKKKILSLLLALVLVLSLLPVTALAGNVPAGEGPDFAANAGATPLTVVLSKQNGYTPYVFDAATYEMVPGDPVTLYIVPVPDGTESVDLVFTENVLAYCYSADGTTSLDKEDRYPGDSYLVGAETATVPVDADGDGTPDCVQVQTPYDATTWNSDVLYAITFQCASFSAFDGTTELKGIAKTENGYTPVYYDASWNPFDGEPVPIYTVTVPTGMETVDLSFSENAIFYSYSADGDYLGGKDRSDGSYIISGDTEPASVDMNGDGEFDYILVQTPYYDGWNSIVLFVITFAYPADFTASAGGTELTEIKQKVKGYTPYVFDSTTYEMVPGNPVPLYTVTVPAGTVTVDLKFPENVLAYCYSADGTKSLDKEDRYPGDSYLVGAETATVPVDADGDGKPDCVQVQTPYDATTWNSDVLYAITFDDGGSGGGGGAKEITEASLRDGLASAYAENGPGSEDAPWITADMIAYAGLKDAAYELTAAQKETEKNAAIKTLFDTKVPGDAAKNIIALVAMGYDPTDLTAADGTKFSGKEKLDAIVFTESGAVNSDEKVLTKYALPYVIMAYRLLPDNTASLQKLIKKAIDIQSDWLSTSAGPDAMTPFMVALAPEYGTNTDVKTALDKAVDVLKGIPEKNGSIDNSPASTGLAIAGFTALGIDPHEIKNSDSGKSLIDGLLALAAKYDGTHLGSSKNTEQSFRGLIAAAKGKGYITYAFDTENLKPAADLSLPYVVFNIQPDNVGAKLVFTGPDGKEVTTENAGIFEKLAEGTYSYTITAEGYETKSGKINVAADTCETVYVSLVRSTPKDPETETVDITVKVLSHDSTKCDGNCTYLHNPSAYYSILGDDNSYVVKLVKGEGTARDALVAALVNYSIHFTEKANGYFPEINYEEEFSHGPNSGWLYLVNGVSAKVAAKDYVFNGNATMIWYFTDDYTKESGSEEWNNESAPSGGSSAGSAADVAPAEVSVKPEVVDGEAKAEINDEDVTKAIEENKDANVLDIKVNTSGADKVEAVLSADAVKAAADADMSLKVETENGAVKVDSKTVDALAGTGKDVALTVTRNSDGTTTVGVTAGGENVDAKVKVELPAAESGKVLVVVDENGKETVVKKSVAEGGKMYAELPAGSTVKVVDAEGKDFGDVKDSDWFVGAVEFVTSHGLFQGTDQGFEPGTTMNRAMLATVLYRLEDAKATGGSSFGDVSPEAWYADAAAWAQETGIITGTDKGFEPDEPVTREQIATMLYRYAGVIGLDTGAKGDLSVFPDGGESSSWASDAMAWAVGVGLFQGDDTGALNPGGEATRAEVAALVERLVKLIVK